MLKFEKAQSISSHQGIERVSIEYYLYLQVILMGNCGKRVLVATSTHFGNICHKCEYWIWGP